MNLYSIANRCAKSAIVAVLGSLTFCSVAVTASNDDFSSLAQNIEETKKLANLPSGTSIIAIQNDKIVYQAHVGYADVANKVKASGDTPYYIASVTKPFMALNVLLDIEHENLSPDLTLSAMFPEFEFNRIAQKQVGIPNLMTHTSAIENYPLVLATAYSGEYDNKSLMALVEHHSTKEPHDLGTFHYTNVGYNLYSIFADQYFKESWQSRMQKQVFSPLQLTRTSATRSLFDTQNIAVAKPYSLMVPSLPDSLPLEKQDTTMHAAGGMYASANDLAKFLMIQLNQGKLNGEQVFPAKVILTSQQKQASTDSNYIDFKRNGYAWGWYTGEYKAQNMLHHFGGFSGVHAHLSFMPDKKLGLVIINNEDFLSSKLTSIIADYVYGKLLNEEHIEQTVEKRFDALNAKVAQIDKILEKQKLKIAERKMNLSLPMNSYLGKYQHPHLGNITISKTEDNQLKVNWGVMNTVATGLNKPDRIRVTLKPTSGEVITFDVDKKVLSLTYQGITFSRI